MRIAIIGRTRMLLEAGWLALARGHEVPLVWTCPADASYDVKEADFERLARDCGAAFQCRTNINSEAGTAQLREAACDLALSINWLYLIKQDAIDAFTHGILNAHAGDLPRYRGNACPNWAILNGEAHVGLCVHQMTPELDAGPVLLRDRFPLSPDIYIGEVYDWLSKRVPSMMVEAAEGLVAGRLRPEPQPKDTNLVLRTYPRRPEDSRIDWTWPAERVLRMVRASSHPFAGAYTSLEGRERVTVWRAELIEHPGAFLAIPGQVCYRLGLDPVIACGEGVLRLTEITLDGRTNGDGAKRIVASSLRNRLI